MHSFQKPSKRAVVISSAAGVAVIGAVALGGAAFAAGPSAMPVPSGGSSSAPAAPPAPRAHQPHIGGEVLTVSGSTVTVKDRDGFTRTIQLSGDVAVTKDGAKSAVSAIVKGEHIDATGTVDANGTTLDATQVSVGRPTPPNGGPGTGRPGHGGPGAPDQGRGGARGQAPTPPNGAPSAPNGSAPAAPSTQPSAPTTGS